MRALVVLATIALAGCSGATHANSSAPGSATGASTGASAPRSGSLAASAAPEKPIVGPGLSTHALAAPSALPLTGTPRKAPAILPGAGAPAAASGPKILSVKTSPAVVHDGDTLLWNVHTTPDVIDVVAHVTAYAFRLQREAAGQYVLTFTIPHGVPFFFHGNYTLDLVGRTAAGIETSAKVPVSFQ